MKKNKYTLVLFLLLLTHSGIFAQLKAQQLSYTYDDAGNRITRELVELPAIETLKEQGEDSTFYQAALSSAFHNWETGRDELKLFPNPTYGMLNIIAEGSIAEKEIELVLYNGNGVQIHQEQGTGSHKSIDLSNQPAGNYILIVKIPDFGKKEYKVIKQ